MFNYVLKTIGDMFFASNGTMYLQMKQTYKNWIFLD